MEQGLLLSKRPSDAAITNSGSNPEISIGNYKGVMLCNRPYAGVQAKSKKSKKSDNTGERSFICGTVAQPWGCNVIIDEKSRVLSRLSKKDGALSKHKKWLYELQKEKERIENCREQERKEKEGKKKKFMEREAKKRALSIYDESCQNAINEDEEFKKNIPNADNDNCEDKERNKPAWALTESAAKEQDQSNEEEEEDALMSFVENLNFQQFTDDMELKILIEQVKSRINDIQREKKKDEIKLQATMDSEEAGKRSDFNVSIENLESISAIKKTENAVIDDDDDEDLVSLVESVKSTSSDSNTIHSKKSMKALITKCRERLNIMEPIRELEYRNEPIIITHQDDDGNRILEKKSLSKLPFKNRNPAL